MMKRINPFRYAGPRSVFSHWFISFSLLLTLFLILFIAITKGIIYTRADRTTLSLLDRALTITWEEYNRYFTTYAARLSLLADADSAEDILPTVTAAVQRDSLVDLWFVTDQQGTVRMASASGDPGALEALARRWQPIWQAGEPVTSSEIISLADLDAYCSALAARALIEEAHGLERDYDALFQMVAMPYRNRDGQIGGIVAVGHLVNNDNSIAERLAAVIPDSYSTIGINGVRIAGNISSKTHPTYVGEVQIPEHVATIERGERYYGRHRLAVDLDHLVVSEPIRNAAGEVVGALTIGHPLEGLASLKEDMALWIYFTAIFCWSVAYVGSLAAAKNWTAPVISLSNIVKRISSADGVSLEHVAMLNSLPPGNTIEMENLLSGFKEMTQALYEKTQQVERYVAELRRERSALRRLTNVLQETNATLEARVEERTRELQATLQELAAASNMKSKLLANTSHELRTPLNSIIGFSDNLINGIYGELTEAQRRRVEIIGESARYLLKLINDLLDVSLAHQGKLELDLQWVHMADLVEFVVSMFRGDAPGITFRTEIAPDLPPVQVDPARIKQVLFNLFTNAVKFSPAGGEVRCQVRREGEELVVSVADDGIGISEEVQPYVFDEFFQADSEYRRQAGFGLGLPLSRELVELHGGRITLHTEQGRGTTITFYVPLRQATAEGGS